MTVLPNSQPVSNFVREIAQHVAEGQDFVTRWNEIAAIAQTIHERAERELKIISLQESLRLQLARPFYERLQTSLDEQVQELLGLDPLREESLRLAQRVEISRFIFKRNLADKVQELLDMPEYDAVITEDWLQVLVSAAPEFRRLPRLIAAKRGKDLEKARAQIWQLLESGDPVEARAALRKLLLFQPTLEERRLLGLSKLARRIRLR